MQYIDIKIFNGEEYVTTKAIKVELCVSGNFFFVWHNEFWGQSAIVEQKTGAKICSLDYMNKFNFNWLREKLANFEKKQNPYLDSTKQQELWVIFFVKENIALCNKIIKSKNLSSLDDFIANYRDKKPILSN